MKIVIVKTTGVKPLELQNRHVQQVRAVREDLEVVAVDADDKEGLQKEVANADIAAGALWALAEVPKTESLKWVHSFSAGMDRILTPDLVDSPVLASNSAGIHATPIAEHVMGFFLLFARKFPQTLKRQEQRVWGKNQDVTELLGKSVAVLGLGNIGKEVARLASCFGMRVLAFDQPGKEKPSFVLEVGGREELHGMLQKADFVVLCLPLTRETHRFFGKELLGHMKSTGILVNIGRGGLVDEGALLEALRQRQIGGAALDVQETEPLPKENPLWDLENVIITPHHSGWSEKYMDRAVERFCVNLQAFLKGERLPNLVDKKAGY